MKKRLPALSLAIVMVLAFAVPALAVDYDHVNIVENRNPVFLGTGQPGYVIFSDGQIDGLYVWLPVGSTLTWAEIDADIRAASGMPGWWGKEEFLGFFYGADVQHSGNHDFWVEQGEGGWYARKTGDNISNTIWWPNDCPNPDWYGIKVIPKIYVSTINTKIVEKWRGEKTPYQTITQYVAKYDSTTLTNAGYSVALDSKNKVIGNDVVVPGSNHFAYAKLDKAALLAGETIDLALVNGSKVDQVGTATVKMADGKLAVEIDGLYSGSAYGFVAADGFLPYAKNGNIHSLGIFKTGSGMEVNILTKDSYQSGDKKAANYDKDWSDITGKNAITDEDFIYLYMHANPIRFDRGADISDIEWKVTKEPEVIWSKTITNTVGPVTEKVPFKVYEGRGDYSEKPALDNDSLSDIPEGWYTVVFYDPYLEDPVVFEVETVANEMLKVTYGAEHSVPGETTVKRIDLPFIENELVIINKTVAVK